MHHVGPLGAGQLLARLTEQEHGVAWLCATDGSTPGDVLDDSEDPHDRRREDRCVAGLVVEADVAAGDGYAELEAGVGKAAYGFRELPHDTGVLG